MCASVGHYNFIYIISGGCGPPRNFFMDHGFRSSGLHEEQHCDSNRTQYLEPICMIFNFSPPLASCVTLTRLLNISVPPSPQL